MKNRMKTGFSLIELLLVLGVIAVLSVAAFITFKNVSENMEVKKQVDFSLDVVTTTRALFENSTLKPEEAEDDLTTSVVSMMRTDSQYYKELYPNNNANLKSPFAENVNISLKSSYGREYENGSFIFIPQYPMIGAYSPSKCIKLSNEYIGKYGNIQIFSSSTGYEEVLANDPDRMKKITQICEEFKPDSSLSAGIGFVF